MRHEEPGQDPEGATPYGKMDRAAGVSATVTRDQAAAGDTFERLLTSIEPMIERISRDADRAELEIDDVDKTR